MGYWQGLVSENRITNFISNDGVLNFSTEFGIFFPHLVDMIEKFKVSFANNERLVWKPSKWGEATCKSMYFHILYKFEVIVYLIFNYK